METQQHHIKMLKNYYKEKKEKVKQFQKYYEDVKFIWNSIC